VAAGPHEWNSLPQFVTDCSQAYGLYSIQSVHRVGVSYLIGATGLWLLRPLAIAGLDPYAVHYRNQQFVQL